MPQQDVELIRALYDAFSGLAEGGDIPSYVTVYFDPDAEYLPVEEEGTIRGHDALVSWNERWFEVWDEFHASVDELIEPGDGVFVTCLTAHGRGSGSGMEIHQRVFHVLELRDHKVLRVREYTDRDDALAAAGVPD